MGGENVRIADFMITNHAVGSRSVRVGSSKNNTRIERLWRDMRNVVLDFYIVLFREFEKDGMDIHDNVAMYVLRYMFLPRIQQDLDQFIRSWNGHHVSTERYLTPLQMMELRKCDVPPAPEELVYVAYDDEDDKLLPNQPHVTTDVLGSPFDEDEQLRYFEQQVQPLQLSESNAALTYRFVDAIKVARDVLNQ